jgi:hypothetical protein
MTNRTFTKTSTLRRYLIEEIVRASKVSRVWLKMLIHTLVWAPTHRFAKLAEEFDEHVSSLGFREACRWVLPRFTNSYSIEGQENIPTEGPLLITSNHPGTVDGLVISAHIPRPDLKIIASGFDFLRNLPATARHMIYTSSDTHERMGVVRQAIRQLKDGGAVLIFPSGGLDPDPEVIPGADQALHRWSPSLEILLRRVPQTRILISIVSGVLSPSALRNPIARLQKSLNDRQRIAEVVQVIQQLIFPHKPSINPRLTFSNPISALDLGGRLERNLILGPLLERAQQTLHTHISQTSLLETNS